MQGYILKNHKNEHLTSKLRWFKHDNDIDAYVHSLKELEEIKQQYEAWIIPPAKMIPAKFENGKVTILGKKQKFNAKNLEIQS